MNADEYDEIRADIWAEPWKDPSLFPDLLNRAVTELGKVATGPVCDCYPAEIPPVMWQGRRPSCPAHGDSSEWAASVLRALGGRARSGVPFDEPPPDEPPPVGEHL